MIGIACGGAQRAVAEDAVYLIAPNSPQARAKVSGRITDFNARELELDIGGAEKRYPAEQVATVEADWSPTHEAADELFARREYAAALPKYEEAVRGEKRRWVQRRLVAQMIWCLRNLDQYRRAGELYLALVRDDPGQLYFAAMPLRWTTVQPSGDLERKSREWLASDKPVAVLLGASHLLPTSDQQEIVKRLEALTDAKDARIAALAQALIWNASFAAATTKQLASWEAALEQFPDSARAGPYFVLGRALAQHKQHEEAALAFLRVPLEYPEDRPLAAAALFQAGRSLEEAQQSAAAARLYRELIAEFAGSRPAQEALQRLESLEPDNARTGAE